MPPRVVTRFDMIREKVLVEQWRRILKAHTYMSFFQPFGNITWGFGAMSHRVKEGINHLHSKMLPPWIARRVIKSTPLEKLDPIFQATPCVVLYSNDPDALVQGLKRIRTLLRDTPLVAAKIGDRVISGQTMDELADGPSHKELTMQLLGMLSAPPHLISVLDRQSKGLASVLQAQNQKLTSVLQIHQSNLEGK